MPGTVYVNFGLDGPSYREAAAGFDSATQRSPDRAGAKWRFITDSQSQKVVDLFREGQAIYRRMD